MEQINKQYEHMENDLKQYIDSYIRQALTVKTDEFEGLQVIDLNNLNLCAVDQDFSYTDDSSDIPPFDNFPDEDIKKILDSDPEDIIDIIQDIHTDNRVIIEFADATVNDTNPVQYNIYVKPGETINNNTVIGDVILNGKSKKIMSIFERATVMSTSDNLDYYRLYPDTCNRHIILTDCLTGIGHTLDVSSLLELTDSFKYEGYLYSLITNNLALSLLPYILSHRIRGVFKQHTYIGFNDTVTLPSKWYFDVENSDLLMDSSTLDNSLYITNEKFEGNRQYNHPYVVYDNINEEAANGVTIFDSSVLNILNELQDKFGADMIGNDVTKADMKNWKKRAKKKKNRKKVKQEINDRVEAGVSKYKTDNPEELFNKEKDRLLNSRDNYINSIIELYENKDSLPLCKYDEEYTDCKFLVNNEIDKEVLNGVKGYDSEFSYTAIGDNEEYYNYYLSLLANINISNEDDKFSKEYYELISDIIDKRLIVEGCNVKTLQKSFCDLYNDNVANIFNLNKDEKKNSEIFINLEFNKLSLKINEFTIENNYTDLSLYMQVYNYINSQIKNDNDEDATNIVATLLATMYTYIKSYGDGNGNQYKDIKTEDDKYLYFKLVIEESNKICEFWDKIIALYRLNDMNSCIENLDNISNSFDEDATWPAPLEINIDDIIYKHYLFENIYDRDDNDSEDLGIGSYDFPDHIEFPEIPESIEVDEQWAIDLLKNGEVQDFENPNVISIKDLKYWQRYFTLATLICLPPTFWNCGLDIPPIILMIPLPCIFIALKCIYIKLFGIIIVFGLAIRGMFPYPIILYVNTTNQPISILTPLLVIIEQIRDVINTKLRDLEMVSVLSLVKALIKILENDSNRIKKENKKLDAYIEVSKNMKIPKAESIKQEFEYITDPSVDLRLKIQRVESISRMNRVL